MALASQHLSPLSPTTLDGCLQQLLVDTQLNLLQHELVQHTVQF
jgi:hypothetical protein